MALVGIDNVSTFMASVRARYYDALPGMNDDKFAAAVFVTSPAAGAQIRIV